MKKTTILVVCLLALGFAGQAQSTYKSAIGARLSGTYYDNFAFSYKFHVTNPGAIELNAGFGSYGRYPGYYNDKRPFFVSFSGAYQHHFDIPVDGLRWFIGGGATVYHASSKNDAYVGTGFGIFPTGGIDYKFAKIPLNLTADFRPTFFVTTHEYYNHFYPNAGIAARYTIN